MKGVREMKKMTAKEFKEALNTAGVNFDVFGFEGILNTLSIKYAKDSEEYSYKGLKAAAAGTYEQSKILYNILNERGYYDN